MATHVPPIPEPGTDTLPETFTLEALRGRARELLDPLTSGYVDSGAGDGRTLQANEQDFGNFTLAPHVLRDVRTVDTQVELFGRTHRGPLLLAPTGSHGLLHPDAEVETVRGANAAGAAMVLSAYSNTPLEEVAGHSEHGLWMQVNAPPDRRFLEGFVEQVNHSAEALVITVDTPVVGTRESQLWDGVTLPAGLSFPMLEGLAVRAEETSRIHRSALDAGFDEVALQRIVSMSGVPVLVKGIQRGDDAIRAISAGAAGIIVSNHGARNLDSGLSTILSLPDVVRAVGGKVPVLLDGGIRRGTDVLIALALGAHAVLLGRPVLWGLATGGRVGVERVIELLRREFAMTMALCGVGQVEDINQDLIHQGE